MKILITNGHLKVGGVEKSLINLLNSIDYNEHQVDLLLFEGYGEYKNMIPKDVNIILWDMNPTYGSVLSVFKTALKKKDFNSIILKIIITLQNKMNIRFLSFLNFFNKTKHFYDCAIAYRVGFCAEYVAYVVKAKKKIVWWHHGEFDYEDTLVNTWKKSLDKMDYIVCVSNSSKHIIEPHFSEYKNKMLVIPNMIIKDEIIKLSMQFNPYTNIDKTILVSIGRLSPEKHMIDVVYTMNELIHNGYDKLIWFVVGDGIERANIEEAIKKYDLTEKIICVGNQKNPYPYLKYADLFVHPSHVESQGISVLESMVLGKRSVIVSSRGVEEFVVDGKNGILSNKNIKDLAEKIVYSLNYNENNDFITYQNDTVIRYSPEVIMRKFYDLIK